MNKLIFAILFIAVYSFYHYKIPLKISSSSDLKHGSLQKDHQLKLHVLSENHQKNISSEKNLIRFPMTTNRVVSI